MASTKDIEEQLRVANSRVEELRRALKEARTAECKIPFKVGDRVSNGLDVYIINDINPWSNTCAGLYGNKIKKDGTVSQRRVFIGQSDELRSVA